MREGEMEKEKKRRLNREGERGSDLGGSSITQLPIPIPIVVPYIYSLSQQKRPFPFFRRLYLIFPLFICIISCSGFPLLHLFAALGSISARFAASGEKQFLPASHFLVLGRHIFLSRDFRGILLPSKQFERRASYRIKANPIHSYKPYANLKVAFT